jgi:hypothetical protein
MGVEPWHNRIVATRSSKPKDHDFMTVGRSTVEKLIGEKLNGEPLDDPNANKNPKAVAAGRIAGKIGGPARAKALSVALRQKIAKKAAQARWKGSSKDETVVSR